ncbi:hypothetical protein N2152v2_006320 [Parachlorella kessleri]
MSSLVQVLLVEYDEELGLRVAAAFSHPSEVWDIDASPTDGTLFGTVHSQPGERPATAVMYTAGGKFGVALFKAQPLASKVTPLCDLSSQHTSRVRQLRWNATDSSTLFTLEDRQVQLWHVREAGVEVSGKALEGESHELGCAAFDPNNSSRMCTAEGGQIQVWKVAFNPTSDNLLLSCSSDNTASLWHINLAASTAQPARPATTVAVTAVAGPAASAAAASAASSAAGAKASRVGAAAEGPQQLKAAASGKGLGKAPARKALPPTGRVQNYTGHEDAVYQTAWSPIDPFSYVSLSHDGRLVLHSVPSSLRHRLLM